jgi:heme/copper-type cytochrome/quinol oxidase subunit 4
MDENKEGVVEGERKVIKVSRKKFVISIVVIVALVLVSFVLLSGGSISFWLNLIIPALLLIAIVLFILGIVNYFITTDLILRSKAKKRMKNSIFFLVAVIVLWGIIRLMTNTFSVGPEQINRSAIPCIPGPGIDCGGTEAFSVNSGLFGKSKSYDFMRYRDYNDQASISDTREFLKTDYNASINTRDVSKVVKFIENAIKGADGRIDSISSTEKYGRISFVVAKSEFEDFRTEIEELTHEKLYTESVSSVNLLTQKQGIEEQQGNIVNSLENWTAQRDALVAKHNQTVASINKEITRIGKELVAIRANIKLETEPIVLTSLLNQETALVKMEATQKKNLASENSSYSLQKQNLDNLINNENNNLTNINKVDSQFMDNVETVNGYIDVSWVSLWEMAKIFSPIHPTFIVIILIILAWAFMRKSRLVPKVVLE